MNLEYITAKKTNGANPFKIFTAIQQVDSESIAFVIKRLHYKVFLETAYWFAVSSMAKSRAGMRCQVCNSPDRIQAHHRTYDTHGYEHLNMADIVVLCDGCHGLFHGHQTIEYKPTRLQSVSPKVRIPKNFVLPHDKSELKMPDGEVIQLTKELIDRCRANGSFTNATLRAFGIQKPMNKGWVIRLEGRYVSRDDYSAALNGKFIYKSGPLAFKDSSTDPHF